MQLTETGQTVYDRTYSRTKPDGAKETWSETVQRVVDGNLILGGGKHLFPDERERLIELMTEFKIVPAGRHLWATGVAGRQFLMNCWVSGWTEDPWEHFRFTFLRLMEGGGVGANYSNKYLADYPRIFGWETETNRGSRMEAGRFPYHVHIVCDPEHPDYQKMKDAGVLSEEYDHEWAGSFEVEDSREGWADALVDLVQTYYRDAKNVNRVFDVSRVRAEGARLKTFGGRASGPLPLAVMLHEVADVLNSRIGQPLDGISAMEIDHAIAKCVVSGGNRRSARMSIMHWADPQIEDFIACKIVSGSHWTTNISVEVDNDFFRLLDGDQTVGPYDGWYGVGWRGEYTGSQWADNVLNLITEGMLNNGEPGFWNSSLSNVNEPNWVACTNPCTTRNTWVQTATGPRRVEDLIGEPFIAIVDGKPYNSTSEGFFKTGHKPVYRLDTDEGWSAEVTSNHEVYLSDGSRVEVQYLTPGDNIRLSDHREVIPWTGAGSEIEGYTLGWLIGDGTFGPNAILQSQGKPETERSRKEMEKFVASLPHRSDFEGWAGPYTTGQYRMGTKALNEVAASWGIVKGNKTITDQVEQGCFQFYRGVLRGLFDTDGHPEYSPNAGVSVRLSSSDYGMLLAVQRMLSRMGIRSSVRLMHGAKDMVCPNTGNTYESKPSFRLLVTNRDNVQRFVDIIGFWHTGKDDRVQTGLASYKTDGYKTKFQATFRDLTYIRDDDVFDCTIPGPYDFCGNGIYMRDCGEIPLEAWEPCNLGHVNLAAFVDPDTGYVDPEGLTDAHELMTRFLIRATFADVTDPKSREVLDRNRRIGVGHLGVASFLAMTGHRFSEAPDSGSFTVFLDRLAGVVDTAAINYAHDLRIPVPVKTRTVAPTGTIAKMPGVSEGIHPIFSKYFVRRIRFSDVDPDQVAQVEKYRAQGYHTEPCQYAPATTVVSIPTKDSLVEAVERIYGEDGADYLVESADDLTLEEMIRFQAMYQTYWADNAVSFTANIDPGEYTPQYLAQLIAFHGEGLKGLTCFPDRSMPQSPYERISKEEYESFAGTTISDGVDEDCASGSCPVR